MATNDFLPFAGGAGANVIDQPTYVALTSILANGFSSGVAQSAQLNKVWRQASIMAAVLAQMIVDNTGQNATDDGTTATLLANLKSAVGGRLLNVQTFNMPGTFTYTPTPGTKSVVVEVLGGGAGGGGVAATGSGQIACAGAGGAGAYAKSRYTSGFAGVNVTVGAAGTGGAAGTNNGNPGGTSSFGALVSAPGGTPGGSLAPSTTIPQGRGGSTLSSPPVGGNIAMCAGAAGGGAIMISSGTGSNAYGASTIYGSGGYGGANGAASPAGSGYGYGGGGYVQIQNIATAVVGGNGGPGLVMVWEYA